MNYCRRLFARRQEFGFGRNFPSNHYWGGTRQPNFLICLVTHNRFLADKLAITRHGNHEQQRISSLTTMIDAGNHLTSKSG